jgi:putative endonuclease
MLASLVSSRTASSAEGIRDREVSPPAQGGEVSDDVHSGGACGSADGARDGLDRVVRGRTGEQVAASFLSERGYRVLAKNQRTPLGELDLVCCTSAQSGTSARSGTPAQVQIVIVEVKARSGDEYGSGLEAIGPRKARRLRAAAMWWLSDRGMLPCSLRFDAVVVALDRHGLPRSLEHVKDILDEEA